MESARGSSQIVHSFTRIYPFPFTAITNRMQRFRKVFAIRTGARECNPQSSLLTSVSRPFRRRISPKISRRLKCPHWLFTETRIRSFQSPTGGALFQDCEECDVEG